MITNFISNLAYRFTSENDISDITWTMCYTSDRFKKLFLNFFFPEFSFDRVAKFEREYSKDDSRADFYIESDGDRFVIECKKGDRNHHFQQYCDTYDIDSKHLGYIVNYYHEEEGFEVKTWEQLYDFISENMPTDDDREKELFCGYLEYLKGVCNIIKITKKMELKGIHSLYSFRVILKQILESHKTEKYSLSWYNNEFKESYYGYNFKVTAEGKKDIWLPIGLWFAYERPILTIGVWRNEGWGKPFYEIIDSKKDILEGCLYADKPYFEDNSYYFEATGRFYSEFKNAETVEEQREVLIKFIDEVVSIYVNN